MTVLEALQAGTEYSNSDLFAKVLADRGLTPASSYTGTTEQQRGVDLALADVFLYLAGHPEIMEGKFSTRYSARQLRDLRQTLFNKWNEPLPERTNGGPTITGKPFPYSGKNYPIW